MDDKTAAEPPARPAASHSAVTGPLGRRRRSVAAAALLLAVAATVGGCGSSAKSAAGAGGAASSPAVSPGAGGSATPSGSPTAGDSAGAPSSSAPGSSEPSPVPTAAPTPAPTSAAPTQPGAGRPTPPPVSTPPATVAPPSDPQAPLKATSYLTQNNQLTVFFFGGICDKYGLKADESKAGQVGVRVVITQKAPAGQACPALAKRETVVADLGQPLQGRTVVDLDTGQDVPLESVPNGGPVSAGN